MSQAREPAFADEPRPDTPPAGDHESADYDADYDAAGESAVKDRGNLKTGLLFLAPNILGFLTFTLVPLIASLVFAFTNWDLTQHNQYKDQFAGTFNGLENFKELWREPEFLRYTGNTLFFMMGIPFGIAGSLIAALLLSRDFGATRKVRAKIIGVGMVASVFIVGASVALYIAGGGGMWAMALLLGSVLSLILMGGVFFGQNVYRTLFYLPAFTSGVATFLLWKKLFNSETGPITRIVAAPLRWLDGVIDVVPAPLVQGLAIFFIAAAAFVAVMGFLKLANWFREGEVGSAATFIPFVLLLLPAVLALDWLGVVDLLGNDVAGLEVAVTESSILLENAGGFLAIVVGAVAIFTIFRFLFGQELRSRAKEGAGSAMMLAAFLMVLQLVFIGLAAVFAGLPAAAATEDGLMPPQWLDDQNWVKPSLMFVGFWGAVGSNTMLLYLAALTNVPGELYEAADIDGATPFQRFWNVTWPQLAPTTFFVVVMATIAGLQGGFEMVRSMTQGGPGGASTPLSYFVYNQGFQVGRIGFASAVAWALFLLVFVVTLFNWTFGNRYVND